MELFYNHAYSTILAHLEKLSACYNLAVIHTHTSELMVALLREQEHDARLCVHPVQKASMQDLMHIMQSLSIQEAHNAIRRARFYAALQVSKYELSGTMSVYDCLPSFIIAALRT